jgi:hypothetical protein
MTTPLLDPVYTIMAEHFQAIEPVEMGDGSDPVESLAQALKDAVDNWYVLRDLERADNADPGPEATHG